MIKLCNHNQEGVLEKIRHGKLDAVALSTSNLVDDIILSMYDKNVFDCLKEHTPDKRAHNTTVPYELVWASTIAAKMKVQTSLSDVPYAIHDHRTLAKMGYTVVDTDGNLKNGLMQESSLRFLLGKYSPKEFIDSYNNVVQKGILPLFDAAPNIHILDCTDLEVNILNNNYEFSGIGVNKMTGRPTRGYKLATLRGLVNDTGVIEDIRFGPISTHDLRLSEEMLRTSPVLKPGDTLINDKGFISRELINYLKTNRNVDTYTSLRKNMDAFIYAVSVAKKQNEWTTHPNKNRNNQVISFVPDVGLYWESSTPNNDVPINSCVVWDKETDNYFVFITTGVSVSARTLIKTYELRPEIEEDYRQLKDFWKIEDFKSTKYNVILFHVVCVLFGYLFFQLYTLLPEGEKFLHKSLPVILKTYIPEALPHVVLYADDEFCILSFIELMEIYAKSSEPIQEMFKGVLG